MITVDRDFFAQSALEVAPRLLGAHFTHQTPEGSVTVRLSEVEAYIGNGVDPGSHAFRGQTARNATMFGDPGHLYAYFTYGMHTCANMVCAPNGRPEGVLLRGGEIVDGVELARHRRPTSRNDRDLAQGPARLTKALGIPLTANGSDLFAAPFRVELADDALEYASGPRTGVSGPGGGVAFPWRFFLTGDPSVSPYKRHRAASP